MLVQLSQGCGGLVGNNFSSETGDGRPVGDSKNTSNDIPSLSEPSKDNILGCYENNSRMVTRGTALMKQQD